MGAWRSSLGRLGLAFLRFVLAAEIMGGNVSRDLGLELRGGSQRASPAWLRARRMESRSGKHTGVGGRRGRVLGLCEGLRARLGLRLVKVSVLGCQAMLEGFPVT